MQSIQLERKITNPLPMQTVLIDKFIVPQESRTEFVEGSRRIQGFIRTLPGFVEGFFHENTDRQSRYNYLTIAVWENELAFENAKQSVAAELKRQGLNPQETRKRLNIESERAVYNRSPY